VPLAERIRDHDDSIATPVTVDEIIGDRTDTDPVVLLSGDLEDDVPTFQKIRGRNGVSSISKLRATPWRST
jgi:hypothetical protein